MQNGSYLISHKIVTKLSQEKLIEKESEFCAKNYEPLPVVLSKGKDVWVWDTDGNKYLDMMSAYSAVSHGHSHPELIKVLHRQSKLLSITSRAFYTETLGAFLEKLIKISGFDVALPMNTGAEAVETIGAQTGDGTDGFGGQAVGMARTRGRARHPAGTRHFGPRVGADGGRRPYGGGVDGGGRTPMLAPPRPKRGAGRRALHDDGDLQCR